MTYLTTSIALHRPQVLPVCQFYSVDIELQDKLRRNLRFAAAENTSIAQDLHILDLTRYFPVTGVMVLLPAVIIHLLDLKSDDPNLRRTTYPLYYQSMKILQRLREIYAAADFANSFLEAGIHRVGIQLIQGFQARASKPTCKFWPQNS